jgi:hypothetical protein
MNAPYSPAPPFPPNPRVGQYFWNYVWNGSAWVCTSTGGMRLITQVFTANGTYIPSPGLVTAHVECFGGGGPGGQFTGNATSARSGAAGGSGAYARKTLDASLVAGGVVVTIGAGGTIAGGTNGGSTSFGALCIATGGLPGNAYSYGGQGGLLAGMVGDVTFAGAAGGNGSSQVVTTSQDFLSGAHGGVMWGGNYNGYNADVGQTTVGMPGDPNSGAGGGGGASNQATAACLGGDGGSGICIVTEYCWADVVSGCQPCPPPSCGGARIAIGWTPHGEFDDGQ